MCICMCMCMRMRMRMGMSMSMSMSMSMYICICIVGLWDIGVEGDGCWRQLRIIRKTMRLGSGALNSSDALQKHN